MQYINDQIGVVVIGRNEGERLKRCLLSVLKNTRQVVYVDSGSTDDSVDYAKSNGIDVVNLDMSIPFSAGRARNEGFDALVNLYPHLNFIQFVDGDCELFDDWLTAASAYLEKNTSCAIVAGRRKERYPDKSVYNLLCDIEWNTPIGKTTSCGGDFMIRKKAFEKVNGFNPIIIAGEEPEMCYRLAENGWDIYRLDHLMTLHDADMTRFSQWWKRAERAGHAYAQGYNLHGRKKMKFNKKPVMKIWLYSFILPVAIIFLSIFVSRKFIITLIVYPLQFLWITIQINERLRSIKKSIRYSFSIIIGRFPQLIGSLTFYYRKFYGKGYKILEYK